MLDPASCKTDPARLRSALPEACVSWIYFAWIGRNLVDVGSRDIAYTMSGPIYVQEERAMLPTSDLHVTVPMYLFGPEAKDAGSNQREVDCEIRGTVSEAGRM